jgi:hypothetical protein
MPSICTSNKRQYSICKNTDKVNHITIKRKSITILYFHTRNKKQAWNCNHTCTVIINWIYVTFKVCAVVTMECTIFWDATPCSLTKFIRCFGGTYCLLALLFRSEDVGNMFLRKISKLLALTSLHSDTL